MPPAEQSDHEEPVRGDYAERQEDERRSLQVLWPAGFEQGEEGAAAREIFQAGRLQPHRRLVRHIAASSTNMNFPNEIIIL